MEIPSAMRKYQQSIMSCTVLGGKLYFCAEGVCRLVRLIQTIQQRVNDRLPVSDCAVT